MPPTTPPAAAFRIGRRSGPTRLPIVVELPLPGGPLVLATREPWPIAKDLFCSELTAWPADAEELERVPVASCRRVGASVQLVLDRGQRRRSLFVWTTKRGRPIVFWRSERSMRATRPGVRAPTARGLDGPLEVVVDLRERYAWRFADLPVTVERRRLPVGDYAAFVDGQLVAVVERKRLEEFAGAAVQGRLQLQLAELATMPRAAVVIEGRLSQLLKGDLKARPGWLLNLVAALQAAYPNVPLLFAESGPLAAGLAYRRVDAPMTCSGRPWARTPTRRRRNHLRTRRCSRPASPSPSRTSPPAPTCTAAGATRSHGRPPARRSPSRRTPSATASSRPRPPTTSTGSCARANWWPRGVGGRGGSSGGVEPAPGRPDSLAIALTRWRFSEPNGHRMSRSSTISGTSSSRSRRSPGSAAPVRSQDNSSSRAIHSGFSITGDSRATGRPSTVISTSSPDCTRSRTRMVSWLSSSTSMRTMLRV